MDELDPEAARALIRHVGELAAPLRELEKLAIGADAGGQLTPDAPRSMS
jgi:hypothetical protein